MADKAIETVRRWEANAVQGGFTQGIITATDVSFCLSKLNHRLYRQGRQYHVKVDIDSRSIDGVPGASRVAVYALMPTWYLKSAWRMAKRAYDRALQSEMAVLNENNLAKWRDFRIGCGIQGIDASDPSDPIPNTGSDLLSNGGIAPQGTSLPWALSATGVQFTAGEYNFSSVVDLDTGGLRTFVVSNASNTTSQYSILTEYQKSRNESASPETVIQDMPYEGLDAEGEDLDYEELQANGNEPPYNAETFPNSIWVKVGVLEKNDPQKSSTGYFCAPLGMVAVMPDDSSSQLLVDAPITFEVKAGGYHGVHAPSM